MLIGSSSASASDPTVRETGPLSRSANSGMFRRWTCFRGAGMLRAGVFISGDFRDVFRILSGHRVRRAGLGLWLVHQPSSVERQRRDCPNAGNLGRCTGRRAGLSQSPISHDSDRRGGGTNHTRDHPRAARRDRLLDRGGVVGSGRLYRYERLGARQCENRAGRAQQSQGRSGDRLQGRRGHRVAGGRARSARGRDLLFHPARDNARRRSAPGARSDGGAELRRVADLDFRASRRRHLHKGGRCRRRPRRQGRGGHPGGRSAQPGRHRRQRRRQCRRLRRDGRRPVRDLCRDDRRDDAARRDLFCAAAARQDADAAAGHRRGVHRDFGDRHVLRPARRRQRHHEGALQGADRHRDPVDRGDRAGDLPRSSAFRIRCR